MMRFVACLVLLFSIPELYGQEGRFLKVYDPLRVCDGYVLWQDKTKCQLMDRNGVVLFNFPGTLVNFLPGQQAIVAHIDGNLVVYNKLMEIAWIKPYYIDHEITVTLDKRILFFSLDDAPVGDYTTHFNSILAVDHDGNEKYSWRTMDRYPEILKYLLRNSDAINYKNKNERDMKKVLFDIAGQLGGSGPTQRDRELFHMNAIQVIPENKLEKVNRAFRKGNLLLSFCTYCDVIKSFIAIVDPNSFAILWTYVMNEPRPIHTPQVLPDGTIIMYVNTYLAGKRIADDFSSVVIIDPIRGKILWQYRETFPNPGNLRDSHGSCQLLPNGNILISNKTGYIYEVTREKTIVWLWHTNETDHLYRAFLYPKSELAWLID